MSSMRSSGPSSRLLGRGRREGIRRRTICLRVHSNEPPGGLFEELPGATSPWDHPRFRGRFNPRCPPRKGDWTETVHFQGFSPHSLDLVAGGTVRLNILGVNARISRSIDFIPFPGGGEPSSRDSMDLRSIPLPSRERIGGFAPRLHEMQTCLYAMIPLAHGSTPRALRTRGCSGRLPGQVLDGPVLRKLSG